MNGVVEDLARPQIEWEVSSLPQSFFIRTSAQSVGNTSQDSKEWFDLFKEGEILYWQDFLPRKALDNCLKSLVIAPKIQNAIPLFCTTANMLRYVGQYLDAQTVINQVERIDSSNLEFRFTRARILYESVPGSLGLEELQVAERLFEEKYSGYKETCFLTSPEFVSALFARILALSAFRRHEKCILNSDYYLSLPNVPSMLRFEIHFRKASSLFEMNKKHEAINYLGKLLSENQLPPVQRLLLFWQRGRMYQAIQSNDLALADFLNSLEIARFDEHKIACYVAIAAIASDRSLSVLSILDQGINMFPNNARIIESRAKIIFRNTLATEQTLFSLQQARRFFNLEPQEYLCQHRVQCIRFLLQLLVSQRNENIFDPNLTRSVLLEFAILLFSPQRGFSEWIIHLDLLYDCAFRVNLLHDVTFVLQDQLKKFENFFSKSKLDKSYYSHFYLMAGMWFAKCTNKSKCELYFRKSALATLNSPEGCNLYMIKEYGQFLNEENKFKETIRMIRRVPSCKFFLNDDLRLLFSNACLHLERYEDAKIALNYGKKPSISNAFSKEIDLSFVNARWNLYSKMMISTHVSRELFSLIYLLEIDLNKHLRVFLRFVYENKIINAILDDIGSTLILDLSSRRLPSILESLLDMGADLSHFDLHGFTAASKAYHSNNFENLLILLSRGAKFSSGDVLSNPSIHANSSEVAMVLHLGERAREVRATKYYRSILDIIYDCTGVNIGMSVMSLISEFMGEIPSHVNMNLTTEFLSILNSSSCESQS